MSPLRRAKVNVACELQAPRADEDVLEELMMPKSIEVAVTTQRAEKPCDFDIVTIQGQDKRISVETRQLRGERWTNFKFPALIGRFQ